MTAGYPVLFERRARDQLAAIERWVAERAGADTGRRIVDELIDRCLALDTFAERGSPRDDIRPGLRTLSHGRRYVIGYVVAGHRVVILGIAGRGQPLGALLDPV